MKWEKMGNLNGFRGSFSARLDDRGRLRIPAKFLQILQNQKNSHLFLTSLNGDHVMAYPIKIWEGIEKRIEQITIFNPDIEEYLSRLSYWGNETEIDSKGRILIPQELRESAGLNEEIVVLGRLNYFVIWNTAQFRQKFMKNEFSPEKLFQVAKAINETPALSGNE